MKLSTINSMAICTLLLSCGGTASDSDGDGGAAATEWLGTFAYGVAISSPTITASITTSSIRDINRFSTVDSSESVTEKAAVFEEVAESSVIEGCQIQIPNFQGLSAKANCYGPNVNYVDHPDGTGGSGQLPTGDLGLWEADESGIPCAVAQINTLVAATSQYIDTAMLMQSSAICLLKNEGTAVPATGETTDFTAAFETAIQEGNPQATVTAATVTALQSGATQYLFTGTTDGMKEYSVTFRVKATSETESEGRIYGYFTAQNKDAFAVVFQKEDNDLKAQMHAGSWSGSSEDSSIFSDAGEIILDESWMGNMNKALINMNTSTGVGQISYAWQAGSGDDKTRVFNAFVQSVDEAKSGCGFFGYGQEFQSTDSSNTNTIDGFLCNWAGPGNSHDLTANANKAQKQCFDMSGSTVTEITAKRAITYAPTVACNDTSGTFTYDWPTHSGDGATNDLINLTTDADFSSYSAPTAPTVSTGI